MENRLLATFWPTPGFRGRTNSWLYSDLLQGLEGELTSVFSTEGTVISVSTVPHCWGRRNENVASTAKCYACTGCTIQTPSTGLQQPSSNNCDAAQSKLQALVYDILPPTTVTGYARGLWQLSVNWLMSCQVWVLISFRGLENQNFAHGERKFLILWSFNGGFLPFFLSFSLSYLPQEMHFGKAMDSHFNRKSRTKVTFLWKPLFTQFRYTTFTSLCPHASLFRVVRYLHLPYQVQPKHFEYWHCQCMLGHFCLCP